MLRKLRSFLFTIRFSLLAMLVVLACIVGYYTIGLMVDAIGKRDNALRAVDAGKVSEHALKAAAALSSEREFTVRALGIGSFIGVIDPALGEEALKYRAAAQQSVTAATEAALSLTRDVAGEHLAALERSNEKVKGLRRRVDKALQTGGMLGD